MNGFRIENQDVNTFLTYEIKDTDTIDSLSFGMLTNNKIKGVAPILFTQRDETKFFKYNITSKAQASQFFSGVVTKNRLLNVILGITSSVMAAEEYMVDTSFFVFDLDYIYIDTTTYEPLMVCLPIISEGRNTQSMQSFFRSLVFTARYDQTENCDYVAKLINYFNSTSVFSLSDFKKLVQNLYNTNSPAPAKQPPVAPPRPMTPPVPVIEDTPRGKTPDIPRESPPMPSDRISSISPVTPPAPQTGDKPSKVGGIEIPGIGKKPDAESEKNKKKKDKKDEGEKMSLLYLVRHYNKENLEKYRAQSGGKSKDSAPQPEKEPKVPGKKPIAPPSGFKIPGQETPSVSSRPDNIATPSTVNPAAGWGAGSAPATKVPGQNNFGTVSADFGDTTVLVAPGAVAGETSVLTANAATAVKPRPYLVRIKNGEKVLIDKPRFRIGKEKSYVDYFIGDNTAISRSHADIIVKGNEYYLVDLNSTNHTFVNGSMIHGNTEVQIKNGNRIKFANEDFDFVEEI